VAQEQMKQTSNIERRTPNAESTGNVAALDVRSSMFDVRRFVWRIVDLIVAAVFIYAGAIKALDPIRFASDIDNYKILPWTISVRLAFYLPWLEIFCGLALIARKLYFGGLSILTGLMSIFIVAAIVDKIRGLDISCGCFGHVSKNWSFSAHLALDCVLLAALLFLLFRQGLFSRSAESQL
jgi:putative oxidoreductase